MSEKTWSRAPLRNYRERRLIAIFWVIAVVLGAFLAWDSRHAMNPDGMCYLDMAEAYLRGDWDMAINGHWSPLYSWLLGLAMVVLKPSPFWEFSVAHLVNFVIYLCTLGSFHFFLLQLLRYNQGVNDGSGGVTLPSWAWIALGYTLFMWSTLNVITISLVTPDVLVPLFVYLASGILLRMRIGSASFLTFILFGLVLGFGYLAKTAMLPLGLVFLGVSFFTARKLRIALPRVLIASVVFLLIAGPYILALSRAKGRLTFGDSGKLTYAFWVNDISLNLHWQGEPAGTGTPKHPTRKICDAPLVYEFGSPIGGTYPAWYDPSYWHEGLDPHFDLKGQIKLFKENGTTLLQTFRSSGLLVGCLILYLFGGKGWSCLRDIAKQWALLVPAIAAFMMYLLICIQPRYLGSFIVLIWLGIFSGMRLPDSPHSKKMMQSAVTAMLFVMMVAIFFSPILSAFSKCGQLMQGQNPWPHPQYEVAQGLSRMGLQPLDKVASVGNSFKAYWARLARAKIVAEIPFTDVDDFWAADRSVRLQVIDRLATTGAKAIVASNIPHLARTDKWQRIGSTGYYAYLLSENGKGGRARGQIFPLDKWS